MSALPLKLAARMATASSRPLVPPAAAIPHLDFRVEDADWERIVPVDEAVARLEQG